MKKLIEIAALLFVVAIPARAQTNSYADTYSYRYDPTVGVEGTLYITTTITGTMTSPGVPCTTPHTPSVAIKQPNGVYTARVYGASFGACSNANFSTTMSFDLGSVGCTNDLLSDGECLFATYPQIYCPQMGYFWHGAAGTFGGARTIQFEYAWTFTKAQDPTGSFPYIQQINCTGETTPPDYQGPFDSQSENFAFLFHALMYRTFKPGPWHYLWEFTPPQNLYSDNSPHTCTKLDAGFPSQTGGPPIPH